MGRVDRFVCVGWLVGDLAMTDDIVTRLRETFDKKLGDFRDLLVAADEIERLREELEASKTALRGWIEMLGELAVSNESD